MLVKEFQIIVGQGRDGEGGWVEGEGRRRDEDRQLEKERKENAHLMRGRGRRIKASS